MSHGGKGYSRPVLLVSVTSPTFLLSLSGIVLPLGMLLGVRGHPGGGQHSVSGLVLSFGPAHSTATLGLACAHVTCVPVPSTVTLEQQALGKTGGGLQAGGAIPEVRLASARKLIPRDVSPSQTGGGSSLSVTSRTS